MKKQSNTEVSIFLPVSLVEKFARHKNFTDILALYVFYYRVALRQRTNQPKATDKYCMEGLGLGRTKFYAAKKVLQNMKIIEQVEVGRTKWKFGTFYIKLLTYQGSQCTRNVTPLEECGFDYDLDNMEDASDAQNTAVCSKPLYSKQQSNAYKDDRNASGASLKPPQAIPIKEVKKVKICPYGHPYGEWPNYKECRGCKVAGECEMNWEYYVREE